MPKNVSVFLARPGLLVVADLFFYFCLLLVQCDKKDWDDDGYKTTSGNKKNKPTLRPTWRNQPYYMDNIDYYGDKPTPRPSYRKYGTPTGNYYPADGYGYRNTYDYASNPTAYDVYTPTQPYNPYAPTPGWYSPYNPNPTTPTGWTGDQWSSPTGWTGDQWSKPSGSEWSSGVWKGTDTKNWWSSTKKYKTARPSSSPSVSSAPSVSSEPSSSPSKSSAPTVSSEPTVSYICHSMFSLFDQIFGTSCF